jgi:hypothetical protein
MRRYQQSTARPPTRVNKYANAGRASGNPGSAASREIAGELWQVSQVLAHPNELPASVSKLLASQATVSASGFVAPLNGQTASDRQLSLFGSLCGKRTIQNLIRNLHPNKTVALDTSHDLIAHLCESGPGGNMNFLTCLTEFACHFHNHISIGHGHRCPLCKQVSTKPRIISSTPSTVGVQTLSSTQFAKHDRVRELQEGGAPSHPWG